MMIMRMIMIMMKLMMTTMKRMRNAKDDQMPNKRDHNKENHNKYHHVKAQIIYIYIFTLCLDVLRSY